jgi:hypothetical protein
MQPNQLQAQASQAAQQGQQQYNADIAQRNAASSQYGAEHAQAAQANQSLQDYAKYLQGAGSGTNLYTSGIQQGNQQYGYDPAAMATASSNLTKAQNAQAGLNAASQSSSGGYGLSGAQLGNYYATQAAPIASAVGAQSNYVGNMLNQAQLGQNFANQYAGAGLQGEQMTSSTLNSVYQNAKAQADQSQQQMQFFSQLAQQQGGLNAQQSQAYATALNAYRQSQLAIAQASQAYAQAGLLGSQTQGQNLTNAAAQTKAAYTFTPNNTGGYNFFNNGQPITVQQYNAATGNNINPAIGHQ